MSDPPADPAEQRSVVRERYGSIADSEATSCCGEATESAADSCCDGDAGGSADAGDDGDTEPPTALGYDPDEVAAAETAAELSLGCGNPNAIAALEAGETVLDLGSGGGFDCFLAAREVGAEGRVIGVDMTPAMVERAREAARDNDRETVEFRLGEIEHLPVGDARVDVVISNCVVNLSPDKQQVFREVERVLRPGGRVAISDVVRTAPFPDDVRLDPDAVAGCVAGAASVEELERMLTNAGLVDVRIEPDEDSAEVIEEWDAERDLGDYLLAATIEARKPA